MKPGMASLFQPSAGTHQAWITSAAVVKNLIFVFVVFSPTQSWTLQLWMQVDVVWLGSISLCVSSIETWARVPWITIASMIEYSSLFRKIAHRATAPQVVELTRPLLAAQCCVWVMMGNAYIRNHMLRMRGHTVCSPCFPSAVWSS